MAATEYLVLVECDLCITVADDAPDDVFTRMMKPENCAWLYGFMDERGVYEHFAHNAATNGVDDASRLEGWDDLKPRMVTLSIRNLEVQQRWDSGRKEWVDALVEKQGDATRD